MTREELIEKALLTREELEDIFDKSNHQNRYDLQVKTAKAQLDKLLNLTYDCEKCRGTKFEDNIHDGNSTICHTCNGTGQGEKILAIVAEEQKTPMDRDVEGGLQPEVKDAYYQGCVDCTKCRLYPEVKKQIAQELKEKLEALLVRWYSCPDVMSTIVKMDCFTCKTNCTNGQLWRYLQSFWKEYGLCGK